MRQRRQVLRGLAMMAALGMSAPGPAGAADSSPRRWRMGSYPSLDAWTRRDFTDQAGGRRALARVERDIARRSGGSFQSAMTRNPALMDMVAQMMDLQPMRTAEFLKGEDRVVIAVVRLSVLDATLLYDACSEEPRITLGGRSFVQMSDPDAGGIVAMLPDISGALLLVRGTVSRSVLQKLITAAHLTELGAAPGPSG